MGRVKASETPAPVSPRLSVRVQMHRTFTKGEPPVPWLLSDDYEVQVDDIDCVTGKTCVPLIPLSDRQMLFDADAHGLLPAAQRHLLGSIVAVEEKLDKHDERSKSGTEGTKPRQTVTDAKRKEYLRNMKRIGFPSTPLTVSAIAEYYLRRSWKLKLNKNKPSLQTLCKRLIPEYQKSLMPELRSGSKRFLK